MSIPLQFTSLYGGQEVLVWPSCLLDLGTVLVVEEIIKQTMSIDLVRERQVLFFSSEVTYSLKLS